jgi:hypothetical protein
MQYDINSIEELIEALGGDTAVAGMFGISQPAVANWKARGQIATGWHMRLYAEVRRMGLSINPAVFGLTEEEFVPLSLVSSTERVAAVR